MSVPNISLSYSNDDEWICILDEHMAEPISVDPAEVWAGVDGSWST